MEMNNRMTVCKTCGQPVAKNAKFCPNCGAKRKKHRILGVVLVILGLSLIGSAISNIDSKPQKVTENTDITQQIEQDKEPQDTGGEQPQGTTEPEYEEEVFGLGDSVLLDGVTVTLTDVTVSDGGQFNKPTDGNEFVLLRFEIENNSNKEIAVSSLLTFVAYFDGYSTNFSLSGLLEKEGQQLDGKIAVGKKMDGSVAYEASKDWKECEIHITPDFWRGHEIVFTCNHDEI